MDVFNILQVSLLSKIMNDQNNHHHPFIIICFFIYGILQMIPYSLREYFENSFKEWISNDNSDSYIMIPYHIKKYSAYGSATPIEKILYSNRFSAINYYIKKNHMDKLYSLTEIINFENTKYAESNSEFILLPKHNQKIKICETENIMFEILIEEHNSDDEKKETSKGKNIHTRKYIYKLSKKGKDSIHSLHSFLEKIVNIYLNEIVNKKKQMVFEYKKTIIDDDDKYSIIFNETPFQSNKSFDNIFFEGKQEFLEDLSKFSKKNEKRNSIIQEYKRNGIPYKGVYLLYGDPGCGKSSLIKASINYLERNCILVEWTKIKTCNDFISLFRPILINNKTYESNEFIIVFEDFDANSSDIVKIREGLKNKKKNPRTQSKDSDSDITEDLNIENPWKKRFEMITKDNVFTGKIDDELTLECILNVLDGIVELYDVIVFFTTNDIDIIDPALKRKGRVDRIIKMEKASHKCIREMLMHRFQLSTILDKHSKKIEKIEEYKIAYSDISQICNQSKNMDDFFQKLGKSNK